ncbi:MAG: hypothetical protein E5V22_16420, partial [Mesorhizobium sp.]
MTKHPLTDAAIAEYWPDMDTPEGRVEIRRQFAALMDQLGLVWHRSFPKHHELFATIAAEKARGLPERVAMLSAALAGLPEHWRQWQWMADAKPVFGEKYVRSVYGDNGHGMGRQVIAAVPADKHYFGTLADFIAAANPDTITMLISAYEGRTAESGGSEAEPSEPLT